MIIQIADYNQSETIIDKHLQVEWKEIESTLLRMPLHLKASDEEGIQDTPMFDPVGTNSFIKDDLVHKQWENNISIPPEFKFLGKDIDFGKSGLLVEAQFSHYSFLFNNTMRSEFFFRSQLNCAGRPVQLAIIITKAHMIKSANSSLYYEQAVKQLNSMNQYHLFDMPIRLVGLFERTGENIPIKWTEYDNRRYSRTVTTRQDLTCSINIPPGKGRIAHIDINFRGQQD
jgi:hypothetical protein